MHATQSSTPSRTHAFLRWGGLATLWLVLVALLLELALPLLDGRYDRFFRHDVRAEKLSLAEATEFVSSPEFDPELGWDRARPVRNAENPTTAWGQSYGNSFTEGAVPIDDTWQVRFEALTGKTILNLGVGGYGLDQAVLKFERHAPRLATRVAILGLYNQMFRRTLAYHAYHYFSNRRSFTYAFKPIFVPNGSGDYALTPPPCTAARCLLDALYGKHAATNRVLAEHDFWFRRNRTRALVAFPRLPDYAAIAPAVLEGRRERQGLHDYYFVTPEALPLVQYLVRRFIATSREIGATPVCVLLYSPSDLAIIAGGRRYDEPLLEFLRGEDVTHVDTASFILARIPVDELPTLDTGDGHLNGEGNELVAQALIEGVRPTGLLR